MCTAFYIESVHISSWRKQEGMQDKEIPRAHHHMEMKLEREDWVKRKGARSHGKALCFHGGKLIKRTSPVWNRCPVLAFLIQDADMFLVQFMGAAGEQMASSAAPHLARLLVSSTPQGEQKLIFPMWVLSSWAVHIVPRPMDLFTW